MIKIVQVESENYFVRAKLLFEENAVSLDIDLSFQNFEEELANLPKDHSPPKGCLLLAFQENQTAGCIAIRKLVGETCEMKRLYVLPQFRKLGIGKLLAKAVIEQACKLGYKRMRLDTLSSMRQAQLLYKSLDFREISPYRFNPIEGTVFMELDL
jgi:ribosomal protein S18 acetylase RimI-like enzyme